jgi:Tfp pilus assembly protein PilE
MKTSKSAIFLFELMIIILVFTLASAICTQIFVRSYTMSQESRALTMGSINAQTVAEQFKSTGNAPDDLYFDKEWSAASEEDAYYTVKFEDNGSTEEMKSADVKIYQTGKNDSIYTLHVKRFEN